MQRLFRIAVCLILFLCTNLEFAAAKPSRSHYRSGGYVNGYTRKDGTRVSGHYRRGTQVNGSSSSLAPSPQINVPSKQPIPIIYFSDIKVIDDTTFIYDEQYYRIMGLKPTAVSEPNYERNKQRLVELLRSGKITLEIVGDEYNGWRWAKVRINNSDVAALFEEHSAGLSTGQNRSLTSLSQQSDLKNQLAKTSSAPCEGETEQTDDEIPEPIARIIAQNELLIQQNEQIIELLKQIAQKK